MRAHRHGMRVVLVVQLDWSGSLRASLAQLGVLVAHLDQNGVFGAWSTSTVARDGRRLRVCLCISWLVERRGDRLGKNDELQLQIAGYLQCRVRGGIQP